MLGIVPVYKHGNKLDPGKYGSIFVLSNIHIFCWRKKWRIIELIILPFEAQQKGRGPGRPRKLSKRQDRVFLRCITNLRKEDGNFTVKRLMERADLNIAHVSWRTVQRFLHSNGYRYLNSRKKSVLLNADFKKRLQFAKKMKTEFHDNVWTEDIAFYLDGVLYTSTIL